MDSKIIYPYSLFKRYNTEAISLLKSAFQIIKDLHVRFRNLVNKKKWQMI